MCLKLFIAEAIKHDIKLVLFIHHGSHIYYIIYRQVFFCRKTSTTLYTRNFSLSSQEATTSRRADGGEREEDNPMFKNKK